MNRTYAFQTAPRCHAKSKRTGKPCQAPAVTTGLYADSMVHAVEAPKGKRMELLSTGSIPEKLSMSAVVSRSYSAAHAWRLARGNERLPGQGTGLPIQWRHCILASCRGGL
jgi:hypothetical protein